MGIDNALAGIAVRDFGKAVAWYEQLLDRPSDPVPAEMPNLAEWQFTRGGGLQLFQDAGRAGSCSATLVVDNLAAQLAVLQRKGIAIGDSRASAMAKVAIVNDPEYNQIVLAQALTDQLAR